MVLLLLASLVRYGNGMCPPSATARMIERVIIMDLDNIHKIQERFKSLKIKDQNNNGVGEYGNTDELAKYILEKDENEFDFIVDKGNFLIGGTYWFKTFLPNQIDEQEKYWLCLAIPESLSKMGYGRSYFLDNKRDIIFYAEKSSLEELDRWSLGKIFYEEPFKSAIDTHMWKILDTSSLTKHYEINHSAIEKYRKTHPWPKEKEPDKTDGK